MGSKNWNEADDYFSLQLWVRRRPPIRPTFPDATPLRYYGVIFPTVLNLIGLSGFNILNCILGGQALSSVSNDNMSWT